MQGQKLHHADPHRLELADPLIDALETLVLAGALLDQGKQLLHRCEVALDGRLAAPELLGELLYRVPPLRAREDAEELPLAHRLRRIEMPPRPLSSQHSE